MIAKTLLIVFCYQKYNHKLLDELILESRSSQKPFCCEALEFYALAGRLLPRFIRKKKKSKCPQLCKRF